MTKDSQLNNHLSENNLIRDYSKPTMGRHLHDDAAAQGSKCNLLDESGLGVDSVSTPTTDFEDETGDRQAPFESSRYNQMLKEAYSTARTSASDHHQQSLVSGTQPPSSRLTNYSVNSHQTPANHDSPRITVAANPPPKYPYGHRELRAGGDTPKSQSMDALGSRYSSGISVDSGGGAGSSAKYSKHADALFYDTVKRPLSFTQAIQLHDSLQRLNNNGGNSSPPARANLAAARNRSNTTTSKDGVVTPSEIRV